MNECIYLKLGRMLNWAEQEIKNIYEEASKLVSKEINIKEK